MHEATLSAVIAGVFSVLTVAYVGWENRRTRRFQHDREQDIERDRIEVEAYKRARDSYEAALNVAAAQIGRFEARIDACERRAVSAEQRADAAERRASRLAALVQALREQMRQAQVPIPTHLDGDVD
jgi:chromosome segregation ATPase